MLETCPNLFRESHRCAGATSSHDHRARVTGPAIGQRGQRCRFSIDWPERVARAAEPRLETGTRRHPIAQRPHRWATRIDAWHDPH